MSTAIYSGDWIEVLRKLPDESVQCCVTSPPYWGLRDYGVAGQLGLERTPEEYVAKMVEGFREVRRVLRKDGTCWINLGDSYANSGTGGNGATGGRDKSTLQSQMPPMGTTPVNKSVPDGMKAKDLVGIPWMVAFALRSDGWYLRQDIIWSKPNPMPESVRDRCTKSHEYIFLLSKSERYYYDSGAIAEQAGTGWNGSSFVSEQDVATKPNLGLSERPQQRRAKELAAQHGLTDEHIAAIRSAGVSDIGKAQVTQDGFGKNTERVMRLAAEAKNALGGYYREFLTLESGRNKRSVWIVTTKPYSEAHFATFPPEIPETCIKAGTKEGDTVLDPFNGAGTTGLVATRLNRNYIGIELNPQYVEMATRRIVNDAPMFNQVENL